MNGRRTLLPTSGQDPGPRASIGDCQVTLDVIGVGIRLAGGCSVAQLAADHGVGPTTIYSWLKAAGLPTPAVLGASAQDRLRRRLRAEGDCLLWTGGTTPQGYPALSIKGRKQSVSHLRLTWAGRALEPRAVVKTRCGQILCVQITHLTVLSASAIPTLTAAAGDTAAGDRHWNSRLSWANVDAIRASSARTNELATQYGVSVSTIGAIRARRRWANEKAR